MTVYGVVRRVVTNREEYQSCLAGLEKLAAEYGGRWLISDEAVRVSEGVWESGKLILVSFPDEESFARWRGSPEYVEFANTAAILRYYRPDLAT
jgi:uncharacterized protein (DUF1330 family)